MSESLTQNLSEGRNSKSSRVLLLPLFLGVLMAALDIAMVGPAIKPVEDYFGIDSRLSAWIIATFALFTLISVPAMAWLADSYGKKRSFLLSVGLFVAGALVCVAAPSIWVLLAGRLLQGIGAAGVFPVASAMIGDAVEPERRGRSLGILGSVFGVAFLVGPTASGFLLLIGWRYLFLFAVPIGLAAFVVGAKVLPASKQAVSKKKLDVVGLLLLTVFVASLSAGLNLIDNSDLLASLLSTRFLVPVGVAILCVSWLIWYERRAENPIVRPGLFAAPGVTLVVLLSIGAGMCEAALVFTAGYASAVFNVDASTAGFMFLPLAASIAIASPMLGWLLDRVGPRAMVVGGALVLFLGLILFGFTSTRAEFYAGSILIGIGQASLLGSALNYIMLGASPPAERATAQGFITLSLNFGIVIGSAVVGAIAASAINSAEGFSTAFKVMAAVALLVAVGGMSVRRQSPAATH